MNNKEMFEKGILTVMGAGIGEYICDYLKESGADTETYEVEQGRKIVKGVVKGAKAHPALVFICHMDMLKVCF